MNPVRPNNSDPSGHSLLKIALYFSGLGMVFAIWIIAGFLGGAWIVDQFGAPPYWKALGAIAGMIMGVVSIILLVKRYLGDQEDG